MRQFFISTVLVLFLGFLPLVNRAQSEDYTLFGPTTEQSQMTQIALDTRPDKSITPQQMMIAIQQLNPGHFSKSNINGLHKGVQLKIPTLAFVKKINPAEADSLVNEQNKQWNSHQIQKILATKQYPASQSVSHSATPIPNVSSSAITSSASLGSPSASSAMASPAPIDHSVASAPIVLASQSGSQAATPQSANSVVTTLTKSTPRVTSLTHETSVPHSLLLKSLVDQLSVQVHRLELQYSATQANIQKTIDQNNMRLDSLEKDNIALKNQVILISNAVSELADKMVSQDQVVNQKISVLQENQSGMKELFAEYGGYIMIALGFIMLCAVGYGLFFSRRRQISEEQLSKVNADTQRKTTHSFVDQRSSPLFQSNKPTAAPNLHEPIISTPASKPAMHDRANPQPQPTLETSNEDPEDEYDYLNSEEGTAAKLDLARAYIDMGDYETARQVLREVRATGKPHLQHQAQQILDKMSVATTTQ